MRKQSREDLEAEKTRLTQENTVLTQGLQAAVDGRIVWYATRKEKDSDGKYKFGLAFLTYKTLLFITFLKNGQRPHTAVYDLDEYVNGPFKLDRDGFTHWYKLAHEEVYKGERLAREHEKMEKEKGAVPA